ncbi:hypothetical protein M9H77_20522 [Catharanthus roseus]|uniref:Uncharacterized protein n=1 Tax=Catharanthus roseus TaxID=4058 RepID=A0ACC0AM07_CATRO|nr:hypothetical protein M9H77_20522 [Catharanthus roseus]
MGRETEHWLLKTEPAEWSWEDQAANGGLSKWDGVKNKQAQKNMKSMRSGDLCFFYHSGSKSRRVVGVVSIVREWYTDDNGEGAVDVKAVGEMRKPVDLAEIKKDKGMKDFGLIRQPRLSVVPVEKGVWKKSFLMQTLAWRPNLTNLLTKTSLSSWRDAAVRFRAFSSSPDYSNQSRGGLHRFYSEKFPGSKGDFVRLQGDEFFHMTKVLRLKVNDRIELFNGKGGLVEGCIQTIDRTGADIAALEQPKLLPPLTTQWHVYAAFGTLKGGRADWLVEKCTELGASSLTPLLTERCQSISENRVDRLQRVIFAASKQCQRLHEMTLKPPTKVCGLLPVVAQSKLSFIGVAEATPVFNSLCSVKRERCGIMIIGPEGDFTERELSMIVEAGATAVGLGPYRLRVETATITLLSTLMLWSDSGTLD